MFGSILIQAPEDGGDGDVLVGDSERLNREVAGRAGRAGDVGELEEDGLSVSR